MSQYPAPSFTQKLPVTKSNTAGETQIGSVSIAGASGTTAYGQVSASLSSDTAVTAVEVTLSSAAFNGAALVDVDIAYGGAGSETVLATIPLIPIYNGSTFRRAVGRLTVPVRIASGQRLAVRFTDAIVTAATTVSIYVYAAPYVNLEGN